MQARGLLFRQGRSRQAAQHQDGLAQGGHERSPTVRADLLGQGHRRLRDQGRDGRDHLLPRRQADAHAAGDEAEHPGGLQELPGRQGRARAGAGEARPGAQDRRHDLLLHGGRRSERSVRQDGPVLREADAVRGGCGLAGRGQPARPAPLGLPLDAGHHPSRRGGVEHRAAAGQDPRGRVQRQVHAARRTHGARDELTGGPQPARREAEAAEAHPRRGRGDPRAGQREARKGAGTPAGIPAGPGGPGDAAGDGPGRKRQRREGAPGNADGPDAHPHGPALRRL